MENIDFVGEDPIIQNGAVTVNGCTSNQDMINHNSLGGLQGGTLNERYHLTKAQWTALAGEGTPYVFTGTTSEYTDGTGAYQTFPNLSVYVPYTNATGPVNLGSNTITAATFNTNSGLALSGTQLNNTTGSIGVVAETSVSITAPSGTTFLDGSSGNSLVINPHSFTFGRNTFTQVVTTTTLTANQTITIPNASGTLALVNDLSGFLTLATPNQNVTQQPIFGNGFTTGAPVYIEYGGEYLGGGTMGGTFSFGPGSIIQFGDIYTNPQRINIYHPDEGPTGIPGLLVDIGTVGTILFGGVTTRVPTIQRSSDNAFAVWATGNSSQILLGDGSLGSYTFQDGVVNEGSGVIGLGGTLTQPIQIGLDNSTFTILDGGYSGQGNLSANYTFSNNSYNSTLIDTDGNNVSFSYEVFTDYNSNVYMSLGSSDQTQGAEFSLAGIGGTFISSFDSAYQMTLGCSTLVPNGSGVPSPIVGITMYSQVDETTSAYYIDTANGAMIIADGIYNTGLIYQEDYSANFVDLSLVTKQWVLSQIAGGGGSGYTFGSGLSNDGFGNISLGDNNFSGSANFYSPNGDSGSFGWQFGTPGGLLSETQIVFASDIVVLQSTGSRATEDDGATLGSINISPTGTIIEYDDVDGDPMQLLIGQTGLIFKDNINFKGPEADSDYSENWTDFSYITKAWTLSQLGGKTPSTYASITYTPVEGMLQTFTDSNTETWGATIVGGGSFRVLGYHNGTVWTVAAR